MGKMEIKKGRVRGSFQTHTNQIGAIVAIASEVGNFILLCYSRVENS